MSWYDFMKKRDRELADRIAGAEDYFRLSPTRWSLYRRLRPVLEQTMRGQCLDAGAGRRAFASTVSGGVEHYVSLDMQSRPGLDCLGSVLSLPFGESSFDSIFCLQVLEHVPDPQQAVREFSRCLKPGGVLVLSVPHLSWLHNEPHDYFRYTHYGLRVLLQRAGMRVEEIMAAGGLLSFLGHIPSMFMKTLFFSIPLFGRLAFGLNSGYAKAVVWLDERIERKKIFALNYIAIARKPQ